MRGGSYTRPQTIHFSFDKFRGFGCNTTDQAFSEFKSNNLDFKNIIYNLSSCKEEEKDSNRMKNMHEVLLAIANHYITGGSAFERDSAR